MLLGARDSFPRWAPSSPTDGGGPKGATTASKRRLDAEMVRRRYAVSRQHARELVEAGKVTVAGAPVFKPARLVDPGDALVVAADPPPYVSRAGQKLAAALDRFGLSPEGQRVIDCGASTGGFTDCVLQRGAREVVAIDVGRAQLHHSLVIDERVHNHERLNVLNVDPVAVGGPAPLVVADLSFISLATVMPALLSLVEPAGSLVVLVKPQFEVGRRAANDGRGVIRDPELWRSVLVATRSTVTAAGAAMMEVMVSPLTGADGNVEFLAHVRHADEPAVTDEVIDRVVDQAAGGVG
ncbi:MAG: TlyA family RNA methyltransferase [Acidimicrobiales bacterium]